MGHRKEEENGAGTADQHGFFGNEAVVFQGFIQPFHHEDICQDLDKHQRKNTLLFFGYRQQGIQAVSQGGEQAGNQPKTEQVGEQGGNSGFIVLNPAGFPHTEIIDPEGGKNQEKGEHGVGTVIKRYLFHAKQPVDVRADQHRDDDVEHAERKLIEGVFQNGLTHRGSFSVRLSAGLSYLV